MTTASYERECVAQMNKECPDDPITVEELGFAEDMEMESAIDDLLEGTTAEIETEDYTFTI